MFQESCLVALDMHDYQTGEELEYTKTPVQLENGITTK